MRAPLIEIVNGTDGYVRAANLGVVLVGDGMPRPTRIPAGDVPRGALPVGVLIALVSGAGLAVVIAYRRTAAVHKA